MTLKETTYSILIIDDEKNIREGLKKALSFYNIFTAENGKDGYKIFLSEKIDLVITDLRMPETDGFELLDKILKEFPETPVIMLTGHGTIENAVDAMRRGAYDFLTKPFNLNKLELIIERALNQKKLINENRKLSAQIAEQQVFSKIIGSSREMKKIFEQIRLIAPAKSSVLLLGESGTGKELICNAIHELYCRGKNLPLIKINISALSPTLLESELFGHEKGAFTGASEEKIGRFEAASQGTIFLDEIGELAKDLQVKLLRVIQEKQIERVGSSKTIPVDVRIIAATNKNLEEEVKKGNFREDLYYRLNVVTLTLPPLRERKSDIESIARYYFEKFSEENNKNISVSSGVYNALGNYEWPGNVRELINIVERMVVMAAEERITPKELPAQFRKFDFHEEFIRIPYALPMKDAEIKIIEDTIKYCRGNKTEAARILQIGRKTLHRRLDEDYEDETDEKAEKNGDGGN